MLRNCLFIPYWKNVSIIFHKKIPDRGVEFIELFNVTKEFKVISVSRVHLQQNKKKIKFSVLNVAYIGHMHN